MAELIVGSQLIGRQVGSEVEDITPPLPVICWAAPSGS
jgi:hypothetical protein